MSAKSSSPAVGADGGAGGEQSRDRYAGDRERLVAEPGGAGVCRGSRGSSASRLRRWPENTSVRLAVGRALEGDGRALAEPVGEPVLPLVALEERVAVGVASPRRTSPREARHPTRRDRACWSGMKRDGNPRWCPRSRSTTAKPRPTFSLVSLPPVVFHEICRSPTRALAGTAKRNSSIGRPSGSTPSAGLVSNSASRLSEATKEAIELKPVRS